MNDEPVEIETGSIESATATVPFCPDCGARLEDGKCTNAECPTLVAAALHSIAEMTPANGTQSLDYETIPDTGYWCSVHRLRFDTFEQMREHVRSHHDVS